MSYEILDSRPYVALPKADPQVLASIRQAEAVFRDMPQVVIHTKHLIHAGLYVRTIMVPAGVVITGAFIQVPTVVIVSGAATVNVGSEPVSLVGYNVIAASACRKQVFIAHQDTHITMVFPFDGESVEDAEEYFTSEAHLLSSRSDGALNEITITRV